jgi:hypothetical protein
MIEDEGHIESRPYREPLQPTSHDHQDDEGQCVPGIDRRRDEKRATIKPAAGHEHRFPRGAHHSHDRARDRQQQRDRHAPVLRQPAEQGEPAASVVALLLPVAGQEAEHQNTDRHEMRQVRPRYQTHDGQCRTPAATPQKDREQ